MAAENESSVVSSLLGKAKAAVKRVLRASHHEATPGRQGVVVGNPHEVALFETPLGRYYLPVNVTSDIVVAEMKAGRIFEPAIIDAARPFVKPGSTVLDIGANFGQMTLLFSEMVGDEGQVYSFEAEEFIFSVLQKNIEANGRRNVIAVGKAVYDKDGQVMFYPEPDFQRFGSFGSYGLDPTAKAGRAVETITIDGLDIHTPISFMKVDVQGSDLFVLRGSVQTIARHRMPIIFEYDVPLQGDFKTNLDDYMAFVKSIGYRVERIVDGINYLIVPEGMPPGA